MPLYGFQESQKSNSLFSPMTTATLTNILKRYTDLPSLLGILNSKSITLLDPEYWGDRNDAYYLALYKEKKALKSVLALCLSQAAETFHHWKVFAPGASGVSIEFDKKILLRAIKSHGGIEAREVDYLTINQARALSRRTDELPFVKRAGYRPESEFRLLYTSRIEQHESLPVSIPISSIRSVTLSPWLHESLSAPVKEMITRIDGCGKLKVARSTLVSNKEWKSYGAAAT
jgi:hypothetical protein